MSGSIGLSHFLFTVCAWTVLAIQYGPMVAISGSADHPGIRNVG